MPRAADAIISELVVEVEEEALQDGTLFLIRKLGHLRGVLGERWVFTTSLTALMAALSSAT
jgi:hypothetical protein